MGKQHPGLAVLEHEGLARCRVAWIDRHIGTSRLENAQQADDHLQGAFHANTDQHLGTYAQFAQMMGELIGAAIQFLVSQAPAFESDRYRLRSAFRLRLEQFVDT